MITCPICNNETCDSKITHTLLKVNILECESCDYKFVDCSSLTDAEIGRQQDINSKTFGTNKRRNTEYANLVHTLANLHHIKSVIEIGTPRDHDFLTKLHSLVGNSVSLHSHDILVHELPEYVIFHNDMNNIPHIDLSLCIHTLEHIPPHKLIEFINNIKRISSDYVIEVPLCETEKRVIASSANPHYSFFTERSIKTLFGKDINIIKGNLTIKFSSKNIELK